MKKLALIALVLLASVVAGREQPPVASPAPRPESPRTEPAATIDDLDVTKLARGRKHGQFEDLFAIQAPVAPQSVPAALTRPEPPPPPAEPTAPALPYTYLGRLTKGGKVTVYLVRNQEIVLAETGATLDGNYRVERITDTAVQFVYLPLQIRQDLNIPQTP
jgi:hypothetical protein